ncbi:TRAP transporter small permease [Leucobacter aridicollis]|uniref:TRAP transporter small permease n=1 Tax=Leucobacter aridicollis TaxID=283878 RepID=UPI000E64A8B7|nr:TRAP transporter small permease [Leucobacter aridicollis]UTX54338.1 TRAP transporter small permease [Leucobacter aridicollis]
MNGVAGEDREHRLKWPGAEASRFDRGYAITDRWLGRIEVFLEAGAQLALAGLMLLTVLNAAARYFFNSPITGTLDIVVLYVLPALVWLAVPKLQAGNGQIRATFLVNTFNPLWRKIADLLAALVMFGLTLLMLEGALGEFAARNGTYLSGQIRMPVGPSWLIVVLGLIGLGLRLLVSAVGLFVPRREDASGQEQPGLEAGATHA